MKVSLAIALGLFAVPVVLAQSLPWMLTLHATGNDTTQIKAKYHAESALRWKVEQKRRLCLAEHGAFSHSALQTDCTQTGSLFACRSSETVTCR